MDYYESVMLHYLRADRSIFVNPECCIQLNQSNSPDKSGPHWYCDAAAVDFRNRSIFLCEVSYSKELKTLTDRIGEWHQNWEKVCYALVRDSFLSKDWPVRPWLFVPEHLIHLLLRRLDKIGAGQPLKFNPRITTLEMVQPWHFQSWNRVGEAAKPASIPVEMQI